MITKEVHQLARKKIIKMKMKAMMKIQKTKNPQNGV
jgi:hypothetical protein